MDRGAVTARTTAAVILLAGLAAGPSRGAGLPVPAPRFGHTVDIGLVSGKVIVTPPSQPPFALGAQDRSIPIGSLIDTTHGRVDLRAAPVSATATHARAASVPATATHARAAQVQDVEFFGGAFRVSQSRAIPVTQIRLVGGARAVCTGAAGQASAAALPHRVLRLLHASGIGRFQTTGRYAAATVRGTIWLTEDFCDGTLVRVSRGVVAVEDLVKHGTVTVLAGQSYFARAPAS